MKAEDLSDVHYEVDRGLAWVTINRPDRMNAFRARTVDELIWAFKTAWADNAVGVICLTGAGDRAFCSGGDQKQRQGRRHRNDGDRKLHADGVGDRLTSEVGGAQQRQRSSPRRGDTAPPGGRGRPVGWCASVATT